MKLYHNGKDNLCREKHTFNKNSYGELSLFSSVVRREKVDFIQCK